MKLKHQRQQLEQSRDTDEKKVVKFIRDNKGQDRKEKL